eukprot:SAG22_NODE_11804_length_468_cov_1.333333_1_plen_108_part_10
MSDSISIGTHITPDLIASKKIFMLPGGADAMGWFLNEVYPIFDNFAKSDRGKSDHFSVEVNEHMIIVKKNTKAGQIAEMRAMESKGATLTRLAASGNGNHLLQEVTPV